MPVVHFRFASVDATLTSGTITVWSPRLRPGGTSAITGEKRETLLVSGEASIDLEPGPVVGHITGDGATHQLKFTVPSLDETVEFLDLLEEGYSYEPEIVQAAQQAAREARASAASAAASAAVVGSAERVLEAESASVSAQSAAESARDSASSSASTSTSSASDSAAARDAAVAARGGAEAAQAGAETARDAAVLAQGDAAASADHAEERAEWSETSANNAAESEALALEHSQVTVGKITTGVEVIDLKDKLLSGVLLTGDGGSSAASTTATVVRCGATCTLVLNRVNRSETTWGEVLPAGSVPVEWLPVDADGKTLSFAGHLFCGDNGDSAELIIRQTGGVYVSSMVTGQPYAGSVSWPAPSMELPIADAVLDIKADVEASASAAARSEQSAFEYAQSAAQVAQLEVERLVNGAPEALDTLSELAVALEDQQDAVAVLVSTISEKPSKEYVDAVKTTADAALPASKIQVVAALPESPVEGTIYLVTGA